MKKVFFDAETTGLPDKKAAWATDYHGFPYIVQLSWKAKGVLKDFIIKPDGYEIPEEAAAIHGITTARALAEGVPLESVIGDFIEDCFEADRIIGHNIYFDTSIIKANILRMADKCPDFRETSAAARMVDALHKEKRLDTMRKTTAFCALPFPSGKKGNKFPTLEELYAKLFNGEKFEAHNSRADVIACESCYNKLLELGIIDETARPAADGACNE